jgi:hypothetical protein
MNGRDFFMPGFGFGNNQYFMAEEVDSVFRRVLKATT